MRVISQPTPNHDRPLALDLLLRAAAVAGVALLIMGLLPEIARAVA
jgi:hypothetical protein